jgi:hypothetical protein
MEQDSTEQKRIIKTSERNEEQHKHTQTQQQQHNSLKMQVLKGRKKGQGSGCVVDSTVRRIGMMRG